MDSLLALGSIAQNIWHTLVANIGTTQSRSLKLVPFHDFFNIDFGRALRAEQLLAHDHERIGRNLAFSILNGIAHPNTMLAGITTEDLRSQA